MLTVLLFFEGNLCLFFEMTERFDILKQILHTESFCDFLKSSYHRAREQKFFEIKTKNFFFDASMKFGFLGSKI